MTDAEREALVDQFLAAIRIDERYVVEMMRAHHVRVEQRLRAADLSRARRAATAAKA